MLNRGKPRGSKFLREVHVAEVTRPKIAEVDLT